MLFDILILIEIQFYLMKFESYVIAKKNWRQINYLSTGNS